MTLGGARSGRPPSGHPDFETAHVTAWRDTTGSLLVEHRMTTERDDPWDVATITESFAEALRLRRARQGKRIIRRFADVLGRGRVLDYGCGQRAFLDQLLAAGYDATGCDVGVPGAGLPRSGDSGDRFIKLDHPWAMPSAGSWTTLVLLDVLEHHPSPGVFLRSLGSPSFLLIKVPLLTGPIGRLALAGVRAGRPALMEKLLLVGDVSPHVCFFTAVGLDRVAESAGYVRRRRLNLADVGVEMPDRIRGLADVPTPVRAAMAASGAGLAAIAPLWPDTAVFMYEKVSRSP